MDCGFQSLNELIGEDNRPMRFALWNCESPDAARLREVVIILQPDFLTSKPAS
jgi:hypothetical protein